MEGGRERIFFLKAKGAVILGVRLLGYGKKGLKRNPVSDKMGVPPTGH